VIVIAAALPIFEITFIPLFWPGMPMLSYFPFLVFDFVCVVDIYVFTHTAYLSRGVFVLSPRRISRRIGTVALVIRVIGAIPLGWIGRLMSEGGWHVIFSLNRLLRFHRVVEAVDTIQHSLVYTSWIATLFPLWLMLLGSIHLLTCIFYGCGLLENVFENDSWLTKLAPEETASKPRLYVYALYFVASTIWTIGTGPFTCSTTTERVLLISMSLVGVFVNAYCVGAMVSFLMDPIAHEFMTEFRGMWDYLRFQRMPNALKTEIVNVFQAKWDSYKGGTEPRLVFGGIPETVRDRIKLDITRTCFMKISMMQLATERLLIAFANVMKPFTACPREVIIRENEQLPTLHLFRSGVVQIWVNDSFFAQNNCDAGIGMGELELLVDMPREMTVIAVTYVEGWVLHRDDLVLSMRHQIALRNELLQICRLVFPAYFTQIKGLLSKVGPHERIEKRRKSSSFFDDDGGEDSSSHGG
jgi:hyperpolarization activated cyclic nucleotide-gated potassium channel 2